MKYEVISYPLKIKPNTEYHVEVEVTPGWLGARTDDWAYFYEDGIEPTNEMIRKTYRRTTIHHKSHSNKINRPYTLSIVIEPQHVSKLTETDMVLSLAAFNGQYDPFLSALLGGGGARIHYSREGDTYYATGEIEKTT